MKVTKEQFIGVTYEELLAENAELREERDGWKKVCVDQEVMHVMHEDALDNENAKLRELCAGLLTGYECGYGELCKGCEWDGIGESKTFSCLPRVKARELGVEV